MADFSATKDMLTTSEVIAILGASRGCVYRWRVRGLLGKTERQQLRGKRGYPSYLFNKHDVMRLKQTLQIEQGRSE